MRFSLSPHSVTILVRSKTFDNCFGNDLINEVPLFYLKNLFTNIFYVQLFVPSVEDDVIPDCVV